MATTKFRIFRKNKNPVVSRSFIVLGLLSISVLILSLNENYFSSEIISSVFTITGIVSTILLIVFGFTRNFEKKKLNGQFTGFLKLNSDRVNINNVDYFLHEIEKIEFKISDYNKNFEFSFSGSNIDPAISNGVNNEILIYLKNKKIKKEFFQIVSESDFSKKSKPFLMEYHKQGKIPFLKLVDYLNISDYGEIQKFKGEIEN